MNMTMIVMNNAGICTCTCSKGMGPIQIYVAYIIATILTTFYNASLTNKIVISDWKVSNVTPIYKGKGTKEEAGMYRPISLICHIMKIFEK